MQAHHKAIDLLAVFTAKFEPANFWLVILVQWKNNVSLLAQLCKLLCFLVRVRVVSLEVGL